MNEPTELTITDIFAVVLITFGIIWLGIVEYQESDEVKLVRSEGSGFKYTKSFIAILIPIIYLVLDGLASVGDEIVYDRELFVSDYAANTAFEFTSLCFAIFAFCYVKFIKKQKFFTITVEEKLENGEIITKSLPYSKDLVIGGICETIGQIFYMAVVASPFVQGLPIISSYCVLSVVWSRIFLKEKLSVKHYIAIVATLLGIMILGLSEM